MSATTRWTIPGVREALLSKKASAREIAADFFGRIEKRNPQLNAYLTLSPERAFAQADRAAKSFRRWPAYRWRSKT
jgi:aspartyl-tRNA(Asn)/glutamyl-tRNA(Gln) amidotransferase subunit A